MGTHPREDPEWKWIRMEVIVRDGYECQDCVATGGRKGDSKLHVHHETPVSEEGTNDLNNLTTLCENCHLNRHHKQKHKERGAIKKESETSESVKGPEPPKGVPNRAYVTVKETKPGYEYYYWQWRDEETFKNKYIGSVDKVEFENI